MQPIVKYTIEHEAWNVYQLEDGAKLRMRIVLTGVVRDGVDQFGKPKYNLDHAILTHVEPDSVVDQKIGKE